MAESSLVIEVCDETCVGKIDVRIERSGRSRREERRRDHSDAKRCRCGQQAMAMKPVHDYLSYCRWSLTRPNVSDRVEMFYGGLVTTVNLVIRMGGRK